jgi:hypothetical protein
MGGAIYSVKGATRFWVKVMLKQILVNWKN